LVTATLDSDATLTATAVLTIFPGFLQPLTPENAALGANGSLTVTGFLAEAGGSTSIHFGLAGAADGSGAGMGTLSPANCQRDAKSFTNCTVTYQAPAVATETSTTYIVAYVNGTASRANAAVLLNGAGIVSNPANHQAQAGETLAMGSSGGNNNDYDSSGNQIVDCCSGTLGALIEDSSHRTYLLSNNHVLARSDHASVGDAIIQPGLIDNNCSPSGVSARVTPVATLSGWLPLSSHQTNSDAAIAQVASRSIDLSGSILELGARQADGSLGAAPPGISSSGGRGEMAWLGLKVSKSGRTTGLTCGSVTALDLDVRVDYYLDCAETKPYLSKTFTGQLGVSGDAFSDAGDSGALLVDTANAEPVGLFFAGGADMAGVSEGVATPAPNVLNELSSQLGGNFSYVGGADHPVSCLSYGDNTGSAAQNRLLSDGETARANQALPEARLLVNPASGILGVTAGKSSDHAGEAALLFFVEQGMNVNVPTSVGGVRTVVVATTGRALTRALAAGTTPQTALWNQGTPTLTAAAINQAIAAKRAVASGLMRRNAAFFAVGVGQSLDNPREAALVVYVDRKHVPLQMPQTLGGLRVRYVVMDRLHGSRSYASSGPSRLHCLPHPAGGVEGRELLKPLGLGLK
jgi:hypothetical protein